MSSPLLMKRPSQCRMCRKMFRSKEGLLQHVNTAHIKSAQRSNKFQGNGIPKRISPQNGNEPLVLTIDDDDDDDDVQVMSVDEKLNCNEKEVTSEVETSNCNVTETSKQKTLGQQKNDDADVMDSSEDIVTHPITAGELEVDFKDGKRTDGNSEKEEVGERNVPETNDDDVKTNSDQVLILSNENDSDRGNEVTKTNSDLDDDAENEETTMDGESESLECDALSQTLKEDDPVGGNIEEGEFLKSVEKMEQDHPNLNKENCGEELPTQNETNQNEEIRQTDFVEIKSADSDASVNKLGSDKNDETMDTFKVDNDEDVTICGSVESRTSEKSEFVLVDISKIIANKIVLNESDVKADVDRLIGSFSSRQFETDSSCTDFDPVIRNVQSIARSSFDDNDGDVVLIDDEVNDPDFVPAFRTQLHSTGFKEKTDKGRSEFRTTINNLRYPFQCNICLKKLSSLSVLNRHKVMVHENQFGFRCEQCSKHFSTKQNLKKHFENVHRHHFQFVCKVCKDGFRSQMGLDNHILVDHHHRRVPQKQNELITID